VDVTDLRIRHLSEMLENERRVTRILSQYSDGRSNERDGEWNKTDGQLRDMSIDPLMPVLENMNEPREGSSDVDGARVIKHENKSEMMGPTAQKIYRASMEMNQWITPEKARPETKVKETQMNEVKGQSQEIRGDLEWYEEYMRQKQEGGYGGECKSKKVDQDKEEFKRPSYENKKSGTGTRMKPSQYDGLTPYEDYRVQFHMLAELNGWSEEVKALYLAGCLSKGARSVLNDLAAPDRYSYEKLDGALRERYGTDDQAELFKAKLRSRIKGKEESLQELAHDIRRLVRLAYPGAAMHTHDDLTKDQFIESLGDGDIRWSVFQTRPKNITEALKVAMELEAFKESEKCRIRRSIRGVHAEEPKLGGGEGVPPEEDKKDNNDNKFEEVLQKMIAQIDRMQQGTRGGFEQKGGWPIDSGRGANNEGRNEGPGEARMETGGGRGGGGWNSEGQFGPRRPFDIGRVKCYRCDKMGHYVRDCPDLPKSGVNVGKKNDLNE
jgi:hypothetical protein